MLDRLTDWILRSAGTILVVSILSSIPMIYWAAQLFGDLRADVRQLLPDTTKSVQTLKKIEDRFGGFSQLSILIESPSVEANRRLSDDIVRELSPNPQLRSVRNKIGEEKEFFEARKWLFLETADLETIAERIEDAANDARARANPLLVDLENKGPVELDLSDIEKKYSSRNNLLSRFPNRYFENKDGTNLAVIIRQHGFSLGIQKNKQLVDSVRGTIERLDPKKYHPDLVYGFGGDVASSVEEHGLLVDDLLTATVIVFVLLGVVVVLYYRRYRAVPLLAAPVLVGTVFTFGIGHFIVGYLNASTAFLGPIIPGNGINFGVILLARYIEERRAGQGIEGSLRIAINDTARGTTTAAFGASIAYGSLIATDFLGFKHFGLIGGLGMLLCLLATFTVLPALIVWTERRWPLDPKDELKLYPAGTLSRLPARLASVKAVAWVGLLSGVVSVILTGVFLQDPFEKNLRKMMSTKREDFGNQQYWDNKKDAIFGRSLSPQVILVDRVEDVPSVVSHLDKIIREGGESAPIADVTAMTKLVPADQERKIELLEDIRKLLNDDLLANLSDDQQEKARALRPPEGLAPFTMTDLPESVRSDFRERDGREGLVVLVLSNLKLNLQDADVIGRIADVLRSVPLPDGRTVESSGTFVIFDDIHDAVERDGPKATIYCFIAVGFLILIAFRRWGSIVLIGGTVLLGVSWLGAAMTIWGLKINFLNFIAIPITLGISVDYAANIFSRYLIERRNRTAFDAADQAVTSTGGAVTLCAVTTIIGYASLLIAQNGGLVSFGKIAVLGELTTLVAALVVLPAILKKL